MQEGLLAAEDRDAATAERAATAADATADAPSLSGTFVLLTAAGLYADWTSATGCPRPGFVPDPVFRGETHAFYFLKHHLHNTVFVFCSGNPKDCGSRNL